MIRILQLILYSIILFLADFENQKPLTGSFLSYVHNRATWKISQYTGAGVIRLYFMFMTCTPAFMHVVHCHICSCESVDCKFFVKLVPTLFTCHDLACFIL